PAMPSPFPCTTLFRSPTLALATGVGVVAWLLYSYMVSRFYMADIGIILMIGLVYMFCYLSISIILKFPAFIEFKRLFLARVMKRDRKSTRLNSSHVKI